MNFQSPTTTKTSSSRELRQFWERCKNGCQGNATIALSHRLGCNKTQNRHGNESGTITIKANRYKDREVNLVRYFEVVTKSSSLSSSLMHIKIQYGCPKGTLNCDFGLGFWCRVHEEPDFKLYQAILLKFLLHTNTGACRGIFIIQIWSNWRTGM